MDDPAHDNQYPTAVDYGSPGEVSNSVLEALNDIRAALDNPSVRPKAMITLTVATGAAVSSIFSTHARYYIEKVVLVSAISNATDILAGVDAKVAGLLGGPLGDVETSFIVDAGVDIQAKTQAGGAMFAATPAGVTTIHLVGWIIN